MCFLAGTYRCVGSLLSLVDSLLGSLNFFKRPVTFLSAARYFARQLMFQRQASHFYIQLIQLVDDRSVIRLTAGRSFLLR